MNRSPALPVARGIFAMTAALAAIAACSTTSSKSAADTAAAPATASTSSAPDTMWRTLFDGTNMDSFRGYKMQTMPTGWRIADSALTKSGSVEDIVTRDQFGDFELSLDWKLSPAGNAGIFYRANENNDKVYMSGAEYQLLDDKGHADGKSRLTSAGANYGLDPSPAGVVKPANEWNSTRIVARGAHVEHWLNGQKVVEYEMWSPQWEAKVKASKFAAWKDYGRAKSGVIGFQGDHDGSLAIRNVRIRVLQ